MIVEHLVNDQVKPFNDYENKTEQLIDLFDSISDEYDLFNHFASLGLARHWRSISINLLKGYPTDNILDLATGTADMCLLMAEKLDPKSVTGVDISREMIRVGNEKIRRHHLSDRIALDIQDSSQLNFEPNSFDIVTISFGIRNLEHISLSLRNILQVLKPGGVFLIVEVNEPESKLMKWLYKVYMNFVISIAAFIFHQDKKSYEYLSSSMAVFPHRKRLIDILQNHGFKHLKTRKFSFEVCTAYLMQKPLNVE